MKIVDVYSHRTGSPVFINLIDDGHEILDFLHCSHGFICRYDILSDNDLYFVEKMEAADANR